MAARHLEKSMLLLFAASVVENVLVSYKIQILFPRKQRRLKQHEKLKQSRHLSAKKRKVNKGKPVALSTHFTTTPICWICGRC